jgi:hypothetical protein
MLAFQEANNRLTYSDDEFDSSDAASDSVNDKSFSLVADAPANHL